MDVELAAPLSPADADPVGGFVAGDLEPRAFNYAWMQTEETKTRIFLRNATDRMRRVVAHLFTEEGEEYDFGVLKIRPRGNEVIDLEKIQEEQQPDKLGRTLSPEARQGQFLWFPWEPGPGLLGRAVLEGKQSGAAVSLSGGKKGQVTFL